MIDTDVGGLLSEAIDTLPMNVAILDREGTIVETNRAWQAFAEENDAELQPDAIGVDYLEVTEAADDETAAEAAAGLRELLEGNREEFELEYPCHSPDEERWFVMRAARFAWRGSRYVVVTHTDVTERKKNEIRLRRCEQAIQGATDLICATDREDRYLFANPRYCEYHGLDPERITDYSLSDVFDDEAYESIKRHVDRALAGETVQYRMRRTHPDSGKRWLDIRYYPLEDDEGTIRGVVSTMRDVTDRMEYERTLRTLHELGREIVRTRTEEDLYERTVEAAVELFETQFVGCWRYDPDDDVLHPVCQPDAADDLIDRMPTFEPGSSLAWQVFERGEAEVYDDVREAEEVYDPNTPFRSELLVPLGDYGVIVIASTSTGAFDGTDLDIAASFATAVETALERIEREAELRLFRRAVEQAGEAVLITDRGGTIEYVNPAFEEMTGYLREEAIGRNPRIMKSGKHDDTFYADLWATILDGEVWRNEIINRRRTGELYRAVHTIAPIRKDGETTHFVGIERDVTDRRLREQRLAVSNRILRHNLGNALTAIGGNASLLAERLEDPELLGMVDAIREQTAKLESISDDAAKIHALFDGKTYRTGPRRERSTVDVVELLSDLEPKLQETYPSARIDVRIGDLECVSRGDDRLAFAIREAVENAVVHSDRPDPSVEVTVETTDDGSWVDVSIADDGPGIPDHERAAIERGDETQLVHGSQMGLWLIHWTAASFGGEVLFSENEPRGTVVTIRLPVGDGSGL